MINDLFYKILVLIAFVSIFTNAVYAHDKPEKRIYYLDCSASMTGSKQHPDDNIWEDVKLNLKNAIDAVTDETTELLVVPFANNSDFNQPLPLECKQEYATKEGKRELKKYIDNIATPDYSVNKTMTYHKIPLIDFVNYRIDSSKETYMFLMTDGDDEEKRKFGTETFNNMVNNWQQYTGVKDGNDISDVYGIYVMLNSKYNNKTRENLIKRTDYFWQFNTANVNIKRIKLNTEVVYNIRNEETIAIAIDGNIQGIKFKLSTPYPNDIPFEIKETTIQGDKLIVGILPKENIDVHSLEESKDYIINVKMDGADEFTLLATPRIKLKCISKRENSVTVTHTQSAKTQSQSIWDNIKSMIGIDVDRSASFGTVHYYPSFAWSSDSITSVVDSIYFNFSQDAKLNNKVYAEFQFVDNEGKPYNSNVLTILDGDTPLPNNILLISNTDFAKELKFVFSPEAETGKHQGYFRLINHNHLHRIDHYFLDHLESKVLTENKNDLNNKVNIFQWTLHYKKHLNPLLKNLLWSLVLLLILYLLYLLILFIIKSKKPTFTDKIPAIQFITDPEKSHKNLEPHNSFIFKNYGHLHEHVEFLKFDTSVQKEQVKKGNIFNPLDITRVLKGNSYIYPLKTNIFAKNIELRPTKDGISVFVDGIYKHTINLLEEYETISQKNEEGTLYKLRIKGYKPTV